MPTVIGSCSCSRSSAASASAASASASAQRDHELVAADPADQGRGRRERAQPGGDLGEQPVAGGVAERLVDVAQPVDVEQQDRDDLARVRGPCTASSSALSDPAPVGQAGERVVVGVEAQPVDQAGVLHRDRGVRGERLQQPHVGRRRSG